MEEEDILNMIRNHRSPSVWSETYASNRTLIDSMVAKGVVRWGGSRLYIPVQKEITRPEPALTRQARLWGEAFFSFEVSFQHVHYDYRAAQAIKRKKEKMERLCSNCSWPMKPNGESAWECLNPNCSVYQEVE